VGRLLAGAKDSISRCRPSAAPARAHARAGDYLAAHFHETPIVAVFCFDPAQMAITDAGLDRPSVVGGGSVYPAVQNFLLAARAEGLGCVLTTLLCRFEGRVKELLEFPPAGGLRGDPARLPVRAGHGRLSRRRRTSWRSQTAGNPLPIAPDSPGGTSSWLWGLGFGHRLVGPFR